MANVLSTSFMTASHNLDTSDVCEHILHGITAYAVFAEDDSFGPVARQGICKVCYDAAIREHAAELECCTDCKQMVPNANLQQWKWYDFYAAQGDEPLEICTTCWDAPKHQARMRRDAADRRDEMGDYDY